MSESQRATGKCLCGKVTYEVTGNIGIFQYCHCSRCRKFTGSSHSANLMVAPEQFSWLSGEEYVGRFEPDDTKYLATSFCKICGSSLPWMAKSNKVVVVPAGTLDSDPGLRPTQSIYWGSRACWYVEASELSKFDELPPKRK